MRFLSLILLLVSNLANATSIGYIDSKANKFIVKTKLFFYGPALSETGALNAVKEISRLWNEPKINYNHNGKVYPMKFQFQYALDTRMDYYQQLVSLNQNAKPILIPQATTSNLIKRYEALHFTHQYPLSFNGDVNGQALSEEPNLNMIEMVHSAKDNIGISSMQCGGQQGTFVVENASPKGTTFAHEFGHSLGLPHYFGNNCENETPSIMCARGSYTLAKYQYDPKKRQGEPGGTLNPTYRKVRIEDILNLKIAGIKPNAFGVKVIGPHMKKECQEDHSSI
jgi:hypothetical protein